MLTKFTSFSLLRGVDYTLLARFLAHHYSCLPPAAQELLSERGLDHEEFSRAWAEQFQNAQSFGSPLRQALVDIETLANSENRDLLLRTLTPLPEEYSSIAYCEHRLQQCLHLWILAHSVPGIVFPRPAATEKPLSGATEPPPSNCPSSIGDAQSSIAAPTNETPSAPTAISSPPGPHTPPDFSQTAVNQQSTNPPSHPSTESQPADFACLAALSPADYDRLRKAEAKRLGLRLATLDAEVERCRDAIDEAEADKVFLAVHDPWPEPITDAPALFDAVLARFNTYAYLPDGAAAVCTAFLGHTHAFSAFHYTPRINILSDRETCGKTTLIKIIAALAPKPFRVHNLRPPVVYRVIDKRQPTVLLDEIETFLPLYRELLGLLNAGNSSDSCVPRCEGRDIRAYKAFAPVVLAGIGDLSRTLRSRSILIRMTEAPPDANLTRFDSANLDLEKTLARKLARWAADNLSSIAAADPVLPKPAHNRVADNWRPLFQIAQIIGPPWPQLITDAFHALNQPTPALDSGPVLWTAQPRGGTRLSLGPSGRVASTASQFRHLDDLLFEDIRAAFRSTGASKLSARDLFLALSNIPNRPWPSLSTFSPRPELWLTRHLRTRGIHAQPIWLAGSTTRGYFASNFIELNPPTSPPPNLDPCI